MPSGGTRWPLRRGSWFKIKARPSYMLFKPDWIILTVGECQLGISRSVSLSAVSKRGSLFPPDARPVGAWWVFWLYWSVWEDFETVNLAAANGRLCQWGEKRRVIGSHFWNYLHYQHNFSTQSDPVSRVSNNFISSIYTGLELHI